jgi:outer membrane protein insertion porin family
MTSLFGYGLRIDKRNDPIQPTRGWFADLSQDLAGFGGDVKYLKTETDAVGTGASTRTSSSAPPVRRAISRAGAATTSASTTASTRAATFRGFEIAGIGPRDISTTSNALGAKLYAIGTFELTVPTLLPEQYGIKAAVFSDFGTAGQLDDVDRLNSGGVINPTSRTTWACALRPV